MWCKAILSIFCISLFFLAHNLLELHAQSEYTEKLILWLQQYNTKLLKDILSLMVIIITIIPLALFLTTLNSRSSKIDAFYSFSQICLCFGSIATMKVVLQWSRPYLLFDKVIPQVCECSYGLPSFHCAATAGVFFVLFRDLRPIINSLNRKQPYTSTIRFWKGFSCLLLIIQAFIRAYDGVQSIGDSVCGIILSYIVVKWTELPRQAVRGFLFRKFERVKTNSLSKIWAFMFIAIVTAFVSLWVHLCFKVKERDLTPSEMNNLKKKCPKCEKHMLSASIAGMFALYVIPGLFFCITLMSCDKSSTKWVNLSAGQKRIRFLILFCLRLVLIIPIYQLNAYRYKLTQNTIHFSMALSLALTPCLVYGIPGHLLKCCQLELKSDFIQKNEDPSQDKFRAVIDGSGKHIGQAEKWDPKDIMKLVSQEFESSGLLSLAYDNLGHRTTNESDITGNYSMDTGEYIHADHLNSIENSRKNTQNSNSHTPRGSKGLLDGSENPNFGLIRRDDKFRSVIGGSETTNKNFQA